MSALHLSRRDLDFLLNEWLQVNDLLERPRFADHSAETFAAVLDLSEDIAVNEFAPHNKASDSCEPVMSADGSVQLIPQIKQALDRYNESGLQASSFPVELGGMQLPETIRTACAAWLAAGNAATTSYPFLASAAANLLVAHASPEMIDTYARPIIEGRFYGTMCLSEPDAGSSLADTRTTAEGQADGTWRIRGSKMWISGGDHELGDNIVHLVLAKTPGAPAGVKGLSLFVVPKFLVADDGAVGVRNDVTLVGLNHKMGYRGTTNTLLSFGDGTHAVDEVRGAVGYLVGEEHAGLAYMFHMMNEARIGVGTTAVALGYAGYLHALDYARTRLQGRPVSQRDPSSAPVPIINHPDVRRMLLAQKAYVEGGLALVLYCARLVDEAGTAPEASTRDSAESLLGILTPIAKSFPSQWCVAANDLAIQVHGGYGYTRDYDVEQYYRDNRLNSIHEGTHGIQGLDLLGRKVRSRGGLDFKFLVDRMSATVEVASSAGGVLSQRADQLRPRIEALVETTDTLWRGGDPEVALAHSSVYLEAMGHIVVAWLWLEQCLAADGRTGSFYDGKRAAAGYFYLFELPKVDAQLALLATLDRSTLDLDEAWF
ncbi:acyl-CoA dehydrogenase [Dermatophilaceae bacterium Sec6.4]